MQASYQQTKIFLIILLALLNAVAAAKLLAQEKEKALPQRIALPWKALNYSHSFMIRNKQSLKAANKTWQGQWLRRERPLISDPQITANKKLTINLRQRLQGVMVGETKQDKLGNTSLSAQPIICPLGDQSLVMISIIDTERDYLMGSGHSVIPSQDLFNAQNPDQQPTVSQILSDMLRQAGERAIANAGFQSQLQDALQISFRNVRQVTRQDYGSTLCLNLLVSEVLAKEGYQIIPSIGLEDLRSLKRIYQGKQASMRATRSFKMEWSFPLKPYPAPTSFPLQISLKMEYAESIFASGISAKSPEPSLIEFSQGPDRSLEYKIPEELFQILAQEKQALQYQDKPQISAINRAWVYVDRGRAWGLRMRDRLVIGTEEKIKGHVVGFFGPELGLKSPRGHPIHEGAIIFIRKGQADVRIGQEFDYDQQSYPTPWPPPEKG
ncbi:MAG: hypothetical protein AB8G05_06950 [Oligoflexales bacterium]